MKAETTYKYLVVIGLILLSPLTSHLSPLWAQAKPANMPFLCELGVQGGMSYYVGDASPHLFTNIRETYGVHFRYKFTKRWALQAKVSTQRIAGKYIPDGETEYAKWSNRLYNGDVIAEFNFLRFGSANKYDKRIRPYTPYLFLGLGASMYQSRGASGKTKLSAAGYIPIGIGFKWKFHDRVGLNIAWQHNIYFADDLEAQSTLNNTHKLNGWNWMNCDLTGMLTVGLVFEFARAKKACKLCNQ